MVLQVAADGTVEDLIVARERGLLEVVATQLVLRLVNLDGMKVAIDNVGRIVIPKPLRDELGINGPTDLELTAADGRLELTVPDVPAHIEERDGLAVIVDGWADGAHER